MVNKIVLIVPFMELKLHTLMEAVRTVIVLIVPFMELKCYNYVVSHFIDTVLIVPFMELKFNDRIADLARRLES